MKDSDSSLNYIFWQVIKELLSMEIAMNESFLVVIKQKLI